MRIPYQASVDLNRLKSAARMEGSDALAPQGASVSRGLGAAKKGHVGLVVCLLSTRCAGARGGATGDGRDCWPASSHLCLLGAVAAPPLIIH